jgi:hypothetical protein
MYEHDDDGVLLGGDPASDPGPDSLQLGAGIAAALIVELEHGKFVVPKLKKAARRSARYQTSSVVPPTAKRHPRLSPAAPSEPSHSPSAFKDPADASVCYTESNSRDAPLSLVGRSLFKRDRVDHRARGD